MIPRLRYPERLLQPFKNLRQFTQEFYAMLKDAEADDVSGGVADGPTGARAGVPAGGANAKRAPRGDFDLPEPRDLRRRGEVAPAAGPGKFETVARRINPPERPRRAESVAEGRRREAAAVPRLPEPERRRRPEPRLEPADEPRRRELPAVEFPERRREDPADEPRKPVAFPPPAVAEEPRRPAVPFVNVGADLRGADFFPVGDGGGTTVFVGKVGSGSGDTYDVTLFPDGPDGDPAEGSVTVKVPTIAADERIDDGTWLFGIFQFTDADGNDLYYAQPPVWMD